MKFAKQLEDHGISHWSKAYVDYKSLKKAIRMLSESIKTSSDFLEVSRSFSSSLHMESQKVEDFYQRMLQQCDITLGSVRTAFNQLESGVFHNRMQRRSPSGIQSTAISAAQLNDYAFNFQLSSPVTIISLVDALSKLNTEIVRSLLDNFIPLNKLAVDKILKKFDKTMCLKQPPPPMLLDILPHLSTSTDSSSPSPSTYVALRSVMIEKVKHETCWWHAKELKSLELEIMNLINSIRKYNVRSVSAGVV